MLKRKNERRDDVKLHHKEQNEKTLEKWRCLVLVCALMFTQFNTVNVFANTSVQAEESETKEQITVSVTVVGDSVHGTDAHTRFENWLVNYKVTVDKGATADDAFKKALESNG